MTSLLSARLGSLPAFSVAVTRTANSSSHHAPPLHHTMRLFSSATQARRGLVLSAAGLKASLKAHCIAQQMFRRSALLACAAQPVCRALRERRAVFQRGKLHAASCTAFLEQATPSQPKSERSRKSVQSPPTDTSYKAPEKPVTQHTNQPQRQAFTTAATPSFSARSGSKQAAKDARQVLIDSCPLTPVDELVVAAHMARLSNICYVPEPREQLENLGLKLVAQGKTYFTAWYVADGPDLSEVQENAPLAGLNGQALKSDQSSREAEKGEDGVGSGDGITGGVGPSKRVRYILTHGVRWGAADLDSGRMWRQVMKCWPVELPPVGGLRDSAESPPQEQLVAHQGVLEIAEEVYQGVKPWLGGVEKGEVSIIRFGGHSLGGSVAALLMLLVKIRHGLAAGQVSAHMFGAPAFIARKSVVQKDSHSGSTQSGFSRSQNSPENQLHSSTHHSPSQNPTENPLQASTLHSPSQNSTQNPLHSSTVHPSKLHSSGSGTDHESKSHNSATEDLTSVGAFPSPPAVCPVLAAMNLPAGTIRSVVLDKDPVPRMFLPPDPSYGLLLKSPLVRGLLSWRERVWGVTPDRFLFENVGLVHYMKTVGSEVLVRTLTSEQANKGLRLTLDDFVRQPSDAIKALFDHHRGHYSQDLEAAAAAAKYRNRRQQREQGLHRTAESAGEDGRAGQGAHRTV